MQQNRETWRFMRTRAEQLYEEGDIRRALRMMRLINRRQQEAFEAEMYKNEQTEKTVSTR